MKRSQSKSVSWRKDNPSLEEVFNQVKKMQADGDDVVMLYEGAFSDPLDDNKTYHFPGAVDIYQILAFDDLMDVMLQSIEVSWWVQPIKPYTFEIVVAGQQPSLKIYEIKKGEWPQHITEANQNNEPRSTARAEDETRRELIDPILIEGGWDGLCVTEHYFISSIDDSKNRMDYVLCMEEKGNDDLIPIGIIEAKHKGLPPDHGMEQAKLYGDRFQRNIRFVFSTNGHEFVQFDRLTKQTLKPMPLAKFPTATILKDEYIKGSRKIDKPIQLKKTSKRTRLDPNSIEHARAVIENILPEPIRLSCLQLMTESIRFANHFGAAKWDVTLGQNGKFIRLNAGKIEVCAFYYNLVHLVLDENRLSEDDRLNIERYAILGSSPAYANVLSSIICEFRPDNLVKLKPIIKLSYQSLIDEAANTVRYRTPYHINHSPGILEYLRQVTKQTIPNPIYGEQ